jgi:hypothetical protein
MALPEFAGSVLGSIGGYFTGKKEAEETNKAYLKGKQLDIDAKKAAIEQSADLLTGETPTARTTRQPTELGGGFKVEALGPEKTLLGTPTGDNGPTGDFLRAANVEAASRRQPTYPSLPAAIADAEQSVAQQRNIAQKQVIDPFISQQQRLLGPGHSGIAEATFGNPAIQQLISSLPIARDVGRERYNEQNIIDQQLVQAILNSNVPRAATLTGPGGAASVIPANIPIPAQTPDLSEAITPAATGNLIQQLVMANTAAQTKATTDERLRQILEASGRRLPEQRARIAGVQFPGDVIDSPASVISPEVS